VNKQILVRPSEISLTTVAYITIELKFGMKASTNLVGGVVSTMLPVCDAAVCLLVDQYVVSAIDR